MISRGEWAQADALLQSWQAVHSRVLRFVRVWLDGQLGRPETEVDFSDIVRGDWGNAVWTVSLGLALAFAASTRQDATSCRYSGDDPSGAYLGRK